MLVKERESLAYKARMATFLHFRIIRCRILPVIAMNGGSIAEYLFLIAKTGFILHVRIRIQIINFLFPTNLF